MKKVDGIRRTMYCVYSVLRKYARLLVESRVSIKLDRNAELARAVDVMIARTKRTYILVIKGNKLFSFFRRGVF